MPPTTTTSACAMLLWLALPCVSLTAADSGPVTTVRITDRVLVENTTRLGINLGGDNYYNGAALVKKRTQQNFEGTMYRACHYGPGCDVESVATWFDPKGDWPEIIKGAHYTIISGPSKGTTGTVLDIVDKEYPHQGQTRPFASFLLDQQITPPDDRTRIGILIDSDHTGDGSFRRMDGHWASRQNEIRTGDVPPGSFGCAALCLRGVEETAHVRFSTHYQRFGETNGTWRVKFWAKAVDSSPELTVSADQRFGQSVVLHPGKQWREYDQRILVDSVPEPKSAEDNPHLRFLFEATDGDVLIDDVEIWMEGDENPTAFRDDCVEMLQRFQPGVLRKLQMGGNTLANTIAPPLRSYAYTSQGSAKLGSYNSHVREPYSLHEMYELCEYIGCDPWYCLPGTLTREEMVQFMEYLGAPADVGWGKRRAELGHPRPWTEVFEQIHIEFGNEAWNNAGPYQCGGFNGPDYWEDLIRDGKESPYYTSQMIFHAAGQASYAGRNEGILADVPNADRLSVAPYIIQSLSKKEMATNLSTEDRFFRWAFAWPIHRSRDSGGAMFQNEQFAQAAGVELSIYEVNHHTTHGDGPLEPRNRLTTSIGGGLNVANAMLMMMKEHNLRTQALFSLVQHSYNAQGIGAVRLWGTALSMKAGSARYRPTFLAVAAANFAIGGDLVETVHEGDNPTFDAEGIFFKSEGVQAVRGVPVLWSYGFADGDRRGLILINLDTSEARQVRLKYDTAGAIGSTECRLLTADEISANNEFESEEPRVTLTKVTVPELAVGRPFAMPPFSMMVFSWEVR